jgi:hypothetical protein
LLSLSAKQSQAQNTEVVDKLKRELSSREQANINLKNDLKQEKKRDLQNAKEIKNLRNNQSKDID